MQHHIGVSGEQQHGGQDDKGQNFEKAIKDVHEGAGGLVPLPCTISPNHERVTHLDGQGKSRWVGRFGAPSRI